MTRKILFLLLFFLSSFSYKCQCRINKAILFAMLSCKYLRYPHVYPTCVNVNISIRTTKKKKNNYFNLLENKKRNISLVRTFNTSNYAIWFGARIIFDFYLSQVQENTNAAKITIHSFITFKWFWFKNSQ